MFKKIIKKCLSIFNYLPILLSKICITSDANFTLPKINLLNIVIIYWYHRIHSYYSLLDINENKIEKSLSRFINMIIIKNNLMLTIVNIVKLQSNKNEESAEKNW